MPGLVGVAVGRDVEAALARGVEEGDCLGRAPPHADDTHLDVGDLHGQAGLLPDLDRLPESLETPIRLVARVRHVEAAVAGGRGGHRDELPRVAVASDLVLEARGEAGRALAHPLLDEGGHFRGLFVGRNALEVLSHHELADRGVADHRHDVDGRRRRAQLPEVVADRPGGSAVRTLDDGRDSLRDLRLGKRHRQQLVGRVVVDVDESRREHEAPAVDDALALLRLDVADGRDRVAFHANVRRLKRPSGPVRHAGSRDHERLGAQRRAEKNGEK